MNQPAEPPSAGNLQEWLKWAETKDLPVAGSVVLHQASSAGYADGMLECYREYLDLCEPQLKWYASELGSYRKATAKVLRIPFRRLREAMDHDKDWGGAPPEGSTTAMHRHPSSRACAGTDMHYELSSFGPGFPSRCSRATRALRRAREDDLPSDCRSSSGMQDSSSTTRRRRSTASGTSSLLVAGGHALLRGRSGGRHRDLLCCQDSIKGVNWLTLLSPVARRAARRESAAPRAAQRGHRASRPANRADDSGRARAGARRRERGERLAVLPGGSPGADADTESNHYMLGARIFGKDETRRWMSRFDD
jgi:hypothetical protein